jgi:phosphomannomutase/phosphoglucomutase
LSLARLPLVQAVVISLSLLIGLMMVYLLGSAQLTGERDARQQLLAEHLAQQVAARLSFQQATLAGLARKPEVIDAVADASPLARQALTERLQQGLPHAWKLRVLPLGVKVTDPNLRPPIGYAELDLLNYSAANGKAPAAIAGEGGTPQARIVLAEPVFAGGGQQVAGHLLLAVHFSLVAELVNQLELHGGAVRLQQPRKSGEPQLLASGGDQALTTTNAFVAPVAGSQWQVAFWPAPLTGGGLLWTVAAVGLLLLAVIWAALLLLGGRLRRAITNDLGTAVVMVRDAKAGELNPVYPVQSDDVVGTIHTLREELSTLRAGPAKRKKAPPPPSAVDDTPDIDLELE